MVNDGVLRASSTPVVSWRVITGPRPPIPEDVTFKVVFLGVQICLKLIIHVNPLLDLI